jgi:hypothetical protein
MTTQLCPPAAQSPIFPPFTLVKPEEFVLLIGQLDAVLRLLGEMLDCHPRLKADIIARINSVLDERLRLQSLAAGKIPNQ